LCAVKATAVVLQQTRGMRKALSIAVACGLLGGCSHLLPHESHSVQAPFEDFAAAQRSVEQLVPFSTTVAELQSLGFDLRGPNVTLIPYPGLVDRLAPNPSVPLAELDPGIRECILSRMACEAFEFKLGREARQRTGGFWADFLNFERTTQVSGWSFQALIVVKDGVVLFRNHGGEPHIARTEHQSNPLGPLQPAGEAAAGLVVR
jgi:hypothetical protein